jgi:hypothetical protein
MIFGFSIFSRLLQTLQKFPLFFNKIINLKAEGEIKSTSALPHYLEAMSAVSLLIGYITMSKSLF